MRIIESQKFDIDVTECRNYKGEKNYIVRYGLHTVIAGTIAGAMEEFFSCVKHAMQCEGLYDEQ